MNLLIDMLARLMFSIGDTPLAYAVRSGSVDTVQYLLDHGAIQDKPDNKGSTPLHLAAPRGLSLFFCLHDMS
jgi:ankyrin repeat protein